MWLSLLVPAVLAFAADEPFLKFLLRESPRLDAAAAARTAALLPELAAAVLACAGLGWSLRRLLGSGREREPISLDLALGVGTLSTLLFALGLAGLLGPAACRLLWLGGLACGAWAAASSAWRPLYEPRRGGFDALRAAGWGFIAYMVWNALVKALAYPTSWDAIAYHLPLAKAAFTTHRLPDLPWMLHAHFPGGFELVYSALLSLGDDRLPALLHAACGLAAAHLAYETFKEEGEGAALCAAALFLAFPAFFLNAGHADNDLALALETIASLYALRRWRASGATADWALLACGLSAGFAAAFKLHGLLWCALLAGSVGWAAGPKRSRALALFAACCAAAGGAWYARAWIVFGNPVWPFAWGLFPGKDFNAAAVARVWSGNTWTWAQLVQGPPWGGLYFLALAAAAAVWTRRRWRDWAMVVAPAAAFLLIVAPQHEAPRFALAVLPVLCWLIALGAEALASRGKAAFWAAAALLLPLFYPALNADQAQELYAVCALRSERFPALRPREAYLSNALDMYPAEAWMNRELPATARVLLFREIRGYYLDRDYIWGDPSDQGLLDYYAMSGPAELDRRLRELGITHLLEDGQLGIFAPRPGYYEPRFVTWMDQILRARGRLVFHDDGVRVFALSPAPFPAPAP